MNSIEQLTRILTCDTRRDWQSAVGGGRRGMIFFKLRSSGIQCVRITAAGGKT